MKIGVIGTGTMGQGIVQLAASTGNTVVAFDKMHSALHALLPAIEKTLNRQIEKGKLTVNDRSGILGRIKVATNLQELSKCDLVIEAVSEDLNIKKAIFAEVETVVSEEALLATNTSSLPVTAIASACKKPARVLGLHFFNPAPVMPLVEVVGAIQTDEKVITEGMSIMKSWGKKPVQVKDTPAFIVNRVARPFYGEALRVLEEGIADAQTIDWAMKHIGGFKMGPFELMDFIGLDVNYTVTESVFAAFYYDSRYRPSIMQKRLVEAGRLGRKTGFGFYSYGEKAETPQATANQELGREIFERIFALLVNEAIEAVFWGIATPQAIDEAVIHGVNYPKGLLAWGEEFGLERVLILLEQLHHEYAEERYRPSAMLKRMVVEGAQFPL